jgi:pectate lyase
VDTRMLQLLSVIVMVCLAVTPVGASHLYRGFGQNTHGGEGLTPVTVTNLNDSGTGSLRAAIGSDRSIRFTVAGQINLIKDIDISSRQNLTIDGFDAPGLVTIAGYGFNIDQSTNIIIRNIRSLDARICRGDASGCVTEAFTGRCCLKDDPSTCWGDPDATAQATAAGCTENGTSFSFRHSNFGGVLSHVTSIGSVEGAAVRKGSNNITIDNSLFLSDNQWGAGRLLVSGESAIDSTRARAVTIARNIMQHTAPTRGGSRLPLCDNTTGTVTTCDVRNNLIWDWLNSTASTTWFRFGARGNVVGNYYYDPQLTTDGSASNNDAIRLDTGTLYTSEERKTNYHQVGPTSTTSINDEGNSAVELSAPFYPTKHACIAVLELLRDAGAKPRDAREQGILDDINLRTVGKKCPTLRRTVHY